MIRRALQALTMAGAAVLAPALAAAQAPKRYICANADQFTVQRMGGSVVVRFPESEYWLASKPSGIGERFASSNATLILDGSLAAFAALDRFHLRACHELAS